MGMNEPAYLLKTIYHKVPITINYHHLHYIISTESTLAAKSMEATGLALSAAQTLLAAVGCPQLKQIFSIWGYRSELESLEKTVSSVKAVLLDAQSPDDTQKLTLFARDSIHNLKDIVYEAEDLLDEFATLAKQHPISDDHFVAKVRRLFPLFKKQNIVYKMSKAVKNMRKKLDQTTNEAAKFGFKVDIRHQPNRVFSTDETHSYADENRIVGREEDRKNIVDMLLDPDIQEDVSVLTIVGVGGLGKTTLAQLAYNDQRIQTEFRARRFWVWVSDQDQNESNKSKMILSKILQSATREARADSHTYDTIVQELRNKLGEDKYMLVLDDVWTENPFESQKWLDVLMGSGHRGSRIMVTTRSKGTATAVRSNRLYELKGLSKESSWRLFETAVGREQANRPDLIEMGKDIVKRCANVPLAIKVLGSLLRGQGKNKWRSFHRSKLSEIRKDDNGNSIMEVLKFSYYHLPPALKTCFAYCAIFPKDSVISKKKLLRLWIANGYVELLDGGQVVEEAAEEYFQILVQRCFFQVVGQNYVGQNYVGNIKIHDLMHDIAQEVAGNEMFVRGSDPCSLDKRVRHFFDYGRLSHADDSFVTRTTIRSYVRPDFLIGTSPFPLSSLLANWRRLRVLDLCYLNLQILPDEIGELLHLRYVDLSGNGGLKMIPESFTKLINLEILDLSECKSLKELPTGFCKLVNLRTLQLCQAYQSKGLRYMPLGMEKLTSLSWLDGFVVAERESELKHDFGGLRDLKGLMNLRGSLTIWISKSYKHLKDDDGKGYLSNKQYLNDVYIQFGVPIGKEAPSCMHSDEALLEALQPHENLEVLRLDDYTGVQIPSWARKDNLTIFLPNLVKIVFVGIHEWKELPYLSKLPSLKVLEVCELPKLMYMENRRAGDYSSGSCEEYASSWFFRSLEELTLEYLPKLEGWWNEPSMLESELGMGNDGIGNRNGSMQIDGQHRVPSFPRLSRLHIAGCPRLTSIPLCPTVEKLELRNFNERLQIMIEEENQRDDPANSSHGPNLRCLETDNMRYLRSLPARALQNLEEIDVIGDEIVESLSEVGEAFRSCSSSVRSLVIGECANLRSVSGGLEYLTALDSLALGDLPNLSFEEKETDNMPWRCLHHCLRELAIDEVPQVVNLPTGMACLTSLQSLTICGNQLESIPEWIGCLSSLQSLYLYDCSKLESLPEGMRKLKSLSRLVLRPYSPNLRRRCQAPDGEDWPKIRHIRDIHLY